MSEHYYEVREAKDDVLTNTLVKKNTEVEFTINDLIGYQEQMWKMLSEYRGQMELEIAKKKNVEVHHEDAVALVAGLDPVKQKAVQIWLNAKLKFDELGPTKDKLVDALREDQEEFKKILEQTGLELPAEVTLRDLNGIPTNQEIEEDIAAQALSAQDDSEEISGEGEEK